MRTSIKRFVSVVLVLSLVLSMALTVSATGNKPLLTLSAPRQVQRYSQLYVTVDSTAATVADGKITIYYDADRLLYLSGAEGKAWPNEADLSLQINSEEEGKLIMAFAGAVEAAAGELVELCFYVRSELGETSLTLDAANSYVTGGTVEDVTHTLNVILSDQDLLDLQAAAEAAAAAAAEAQAAAEAAQAAAEAAAAEAGENRDAAEAAQQKAEEAQAAAEAAAAAAEAAAAAAEAANAEAAAEARKAAEEAAAAAASAAAAAEAMVEAQAAQAAAEEAQRLAEEAQAKAEEAQAAAEEAAASTAEDKTNAEAAAQEAAEAQAAAEAAAAAAENAKTAAETAMAAAEQSNLEAAASAALAAQYAAEVAKAHAEIVAMKAEIIEYLAAAQEAAERAEEAQKKAEEAALASAKYYALIELSQIDLSGLNPEQTAAAEEAIAAARAALDTAATPAEVEAILAAAREAVEAAKALVCASEIFNDVAESGWYHEGVDFVVRNGYMNGMSKNLFGLSDDLTRAQLVTILYRMAGEPGVEGLTHSFVDVKPNAYYADALLWAANHGVVNGVTATTFAPDQQITREDIATILYRYCGTPAVAENHLADFVDVKNLHQYAVDAMNWAVSEGLIQGIPVENGLALEPRSNATRAQIAVIIMRFANLLEN